MRDSAVAQEPRPTSVRATVTEAEWLAFRAYALGHGGQSAADLLGDLIRRELAQNGVTT